MGSVDDLTFKVNFSVDGVAQLRERVKDKLKEFMGDYTDDTLVEYVIVLLRNGRRKEEAKNELNVFLGDDSTSFVSWLWEHLASNLKLYVQDEESCADGATKLKPISDDRVRTYDSSHLDSESEKGKANQSSRSRHNREWKGMVRDAAEPPPLRSSVVDNMHCVEKQHRDRKSRSPARHTIQKKRSRPDERQHTKREVDQATIAAPRRLLQFAVRDAVGTSKPYVPDREPSLKRLRSVVSTSTGDLAVLERPQRIKSVATVPNPLATVIKAVAEAAEDVTRVKSGGSVFDRLGRGTDEPELANRPAVFREADVEDDEMQGKTDSVHYDRCGFDRSYIGDMEMLETEAGLAVYSMSDEEHDVDVMGHSDTDAPRSASSRGNKIEDHLMMQYSVAKNFNDMSQVTRNKAEDQRVAAVNVSQKMVNIPLNVNTWKSPNYQEKRVIAESEGRIANQENETRTGKAGVQSMKENSHPVAVGNGNVKPAGEAKRESQIVSASGSYNAGRPSDDADSRTIFVSNVHFAATKDAISRHFNKFGEVLKVVIVTDAATGQPTGSAYVEFMRKEAADSALSLDGTSFMSRILKVVKRSSGQQDAAPVVTWPRVARGSPYTAARFSRAPFPRGIPGGAFRPRLPIKPGARSLQWKREAQPTPAESGAINTIISPTARSLTYIRTNPKSDGNSGTS